MPAGGRRFSWVDLMGSLERARTESSGGGQAAEEKAPIVLAKAAAEWDTGGIMGVGHGGVPSTPPPGPFDKQNVYRTVQMEELKTRKKGRNAEQEEPMVPLNGAAGGRTARTSAAIRRLSCATCFAVLGIPQNNPPAPPPSCCNVPR